jgi:hypothetical protein
MQNTVHAGWSSAFDSPDQGQESKYNIMSSYFTFEAKDKQTWPQGLHLWAHQHISNYMYLA